MPIWRPPVVEGDATRRVSTRDIVMERLSSRIRPGRCRNTSPTRIRGGLDDAGLEHEFGGLLGALRPQGELHAGIGHHGHQFVGRGAVLADPQIGLRGLAPMLVDEVGGVLQGGQEHRHGLRVAGAEFRRRRQGADRMRPDRIEAAGDDMHPRRRQLEMLVRQRAEMRGEGAAATHQPRRRIGMAHRDRVRVELAARRHRRTRGRRGCPASSPASRPSPTAGRSGRRACSRRCP